MKKFMGNLCVFFKNNLAWILPVVSVIVVAALVLVIFNFANGIPVNSKTSYIYDENGNIIGVETTETSGGRSDTEDSYENDTQSSTSYLNSASESEPIKSNDINSDALVLNLPSDNSSSSTPSVTPPTSTPVQPPAPSFISQYKKGSTYPKFSTSNNIVANETITYKTVGTTPLKMNVYYPSDGLKNKNIAIICFEGSAWVHDTANWDGGKLAQTAKYYANRGFVAITVCHRSITYSSDTDVYDLLEDCADAYKYIEDNLDYVNDDYMMLLGESAGGHLALQLSLDSRYGVNPHTVVAMNPVIDLNDKNGGSYYLWETTASSEALRGTASPVNSIRKNNTKYLIVHGKSDELIKYKTITDFVSSMTSAGNTCELYAVNGMKHAFLVFGYISSDDVIIGHMQSMDTTIDNFLGIS